MTDLRDAWRELVRTALTERWALGLYVAFIWLAIVAGVLIAANL